MAVLLMDISKQSSIAKLYKYQKCAMRLIEYKPKQFRSKNLNILLTEYRISNICTRREEQLLSFMYMLSQNVDLINTQLSI